jgi:hypothetical protein
MGFCVFRGPFLGIKRDTRHSSGRTVEGVFLSAVNFPNSVNSVQERIPRLGRGRGLAKSLTAKSFFLEGR